MLDGFAAHTHGLRVLIEPRLRGLDDVFVFPAFDAALVGRCALILERACPVPSWLGPCPAPGKGGVRGAARSSPSQRASCEPLFDLDPRTGVSIEVFYSDPTL